MSGTDSAAMPQTGMDSTGDDGEDSTAGNGPIAFHPKWWFSIKKSTVITVVEYVHISPGYM